MAGIRSTGGAIELTDHVPAADAPAVARLKDAGAIVFGKTNVPRWSGDLQTFNEIFGTTNNPWDLDHVPGGSSGGAAAAVAAGLHVLRAGHRHRRLGAHPVALLRGVRAQAELRRGLPARVPRSRRRWDDRRRHQRVRPDRPECRRPRPAPRRAGRPRRRPGARAGSSSCPRRARRTSPTSASASGSRRRACRSTATSSTSCAMPRTSSRTPARRWRTRIPPSTSTSSRAPVHLTIIVRRGLAEPGDRRSPKPRAAHTSRGSAATSSAPGCAASGPSGSRSYDALLCPVLPVPGVPAQPGRATSCPGR